MLQKYKGNGCVRHVAHCASMSDYGTRNRGVWQCIQQSHRDHGFLNRSPDAMPQSGLVMAGELNGSSCSSFPFGQFLWQEGLFCVSVLFQQEVQFRCSELSFSSDTVSLCEQPRFKISSGNMFSSAASGFSKQPSETDFISILGRFGIAKFPSEISTLPWTLLSAGEETPEYPTCHRMLAQGCIAHPSNNTIIIAQKCPQRKQHKILVVLVFFGPDFPPPPPKKKNSKPSAGES